MEYVRLGKTGLRVSRVCLGCMSYGTPEWQEWVKGEEESLELIRQAYEAGINFFDTANVYSNGESERILGKAIKKFNFPRSRIVVATKVNFLTIDEELKNQPYADNFSDEAKYVNCSGLSRKHIFDSVDASLKRLGLDYIDLYQIHRFDPNTPVEETMEALNDLVRSGKVRYIGASSMSAWEFQKMNYVAEKNGWTKFVAMQNRYNLIYREEEREMIPYCLDEGVGSIHWSPLARGLLTGKNRKTTRMESDPRIKSLFAPEEENNNLIIDRVVEVAEKLGHSPAQVSLAWMYAKKHVTSAIVGISSESHLRDIVGSVSIKLSDKDIEYLEEAYHPHTFIL